MMETKKLIILSITTVVIVMVFGYVIYLTNRPGNLMLKLGETEVNMTINEDAISVKDILDKLFESEESKRESKAILKEFGSFYQANDPSVVDAIEGLDASSTVSKKLRGLLARMTGPFDRSLHNFYDIDDVHLVNAIEKLGFDHPVSQGLRELLTRGKGPFEEKAIEVDLSVPSGDNIPEGRAASCKENALYRREIYVFNQQRSSFVKLYVSSSFPCPELKNNPDNEIAKLIQLSFNDMKKLVGDSPLSKKENGYASIIIDPT